MSFAGALHGGLVAPRRVRVLADHLIRRVGPSARVLDLGSGDGQIAAHMQAVRPDLVVRGVDVLARPQTAIPVDLFDGRTLPYADRSFDAVLIIDVLHHTEDPARLLREARRVSAGSVLLKDHLADPWLGRARLRLMDRVGNARHGVALTYNYLDRKTWRAMFQDVGLAPETWEERLGLYPVAARWLFEDSLHFLAELRPV